MALETIDSALTAINKNDRDVGQPSFPQIATNAPAPAVDSAAEIIAELPNQFNMREVKTAAEAAEIPDSRLRREIAQLIESGALILVEKGQGRRPASFRKA